MHDISEDEALDLLSSPLVCADAPAWTPVKVQAGTVRLGAGVLDSQGVGTQMYVELIYRRSQKTNMTVFVFTLFKRYSYGKERIYQLEVSQTPKRLKDQHRMSHEHMGSVRTVGDAGWATWGYDEVLPHPEHFHLTGE